MAALEELEPEFARFERLRGDDRKTAVRSLEQRVRSGQVALTDSEFEACRSSQRGLPRILAYILLEENRKSATEAVFRSSLLGEMELLKRREFDAQYPRMPFYYAARAYAQRLRLDAALRQSAAADIPLLEQMERELSVNTIDRKGQLLPRIQEALALIRKAEDESTHGPVRTALISRNGVIAAAIIAAVASVAVAVITTFSKHDSPATAAHGASPAPAPAAPRATAPHP